MNRRNFIKNILSISMVGASLPLYSTWANEQKEILQPIDYLYKMQHFNQNFPDDYILPRVQQGTLKKLTQKLSKVESTVGHANFMILSFDSTLNTAKQYPSIGRFSKQEVELMEELFHDNPKKYGFMGEKTVHNITNIIPEKEILKLSYAGNYLFKNVALDKWKSIQKILNNKVILTSGVRNTIKQMHLFCKKTLANNYNLSLASRSLAPAAYSFHSVGDFDVGKPGFGLRNFTQDFLHTTTYARLVEAGVLELRYYDNNSYGVRFEPWHVKV